MRKRTQLAAGRAAARTTLAAILVAFVAVAGAAGQQETKPYDDKLVRLSEILGSIHYLRELCGANEGQYWRDQMQSLIKSEGTTALRRVKLTRGFNKGYRDYRRTYRSCTRSARAAVKRFLDEGTRITSELLETDKGEKSEGRAAQTPSN